MEQQYVAPIDGVEVEIDDLDLISENAALGDDRVFVELFRMTPSSDNSTVGQRGILPASKSPSGSSVSAVVIPSDAADARVKILPFRAFIMLPAALALDAYKNARSAVCAASGNVVDFLTSIGPFANSVQHAAATNNRWDLIYVRIDTDSDDAAEDRYVKDDDDSVAAATLVITKRTRATIGVVVGTEGSVPTRPAPPADAAGAYFIPVAYVLLLAGHTLTTAIAKSNIAEIAPVIPVARSTGAASLRVASGAFSIAGYAESNEHWTVSNGRPNGYMPPTMVGKEEIVLGLHLSGSRRTLPTNSTGNVIDDSADWRNRVFKTRSQFCADSSFQLAWENHGFSGAPNASAGTPEQLPAMGQSFHSDSTTKAFIAEYTGDGSTGLATGATVRLYVDMADGKIKCDVGSTDPACMGFVWIEATGRFDNAF